MVSWRGSPVIEMRSRASASSRTLRRPGSRGASRTRSLACARRPSAPSSPRGGGSGQARARPGRACPRGDRLVCERIRERAPRAGLRREPERARRRGCAPAHALGGGGDAQPRARGARAGDGHDQHGAPERTCARAVRGSRSVGPRGARAQSLRALGGAREPRGAPRVRRLRQLLRRAPPAHASERHRGRRRGLLRAALRAWPPGRARLFRAHAAGLSEEHANLERLCSEEIVELR